MVHASFAAIARGQKHHRRIADDLLSDRCDVLSREESCVRSGRGRDGFGQSRVHRVDECAAAGQDLFCVKRDHV